MIRALPAFALATLVACLGLFGMVSAGDTPQPASPRHIGILLVAWSPESTMVQAFREGLRDAGYVEGRDVVVELRNANGDYDRVPQLAAELVQSKVDVILADSTPATRGAMRATSTIPIVMANIADPVRSGLVANLKHPGGNVTGLTQMMVDLSAKRLQLLKETLPRAARVAVLWNANAPYSPKVIEALKAAAPSLSIKLKFVGVRTPEESIQPCRLSAERTPRRYTLSTIPPSKLIERLFSSSPSRSGYRPRTGRGTEPTKVG